MRFLIVDDDQRSYTHFKINLIREQPDVQIDEAETALDAYDKLAAHGYDVLVLDEFLKNPHLGDRGSTLLRRLRQDPIKWPLPEIIFVTGHYDELPSAVIAETDIPIAVFIEKDDAFEDMLLVAAQLVTRRIDRAIRYTPTDLFSNEFLELIENITSDVIKNPRPGYYGDDQRMQIGTLIRSYVKSLRLRSAWNEDDVLELSIFLAQSLCKVFNLPDTLVQILRRFLYIEEILYTIPKYRDHFFHQIKVFLLGFCILNALNKRGCLDRDLAGEDGMKLWFMTSAFHDIGYPFEKMDRWLTEFVEGTLRSPGDTEWDRTRVPVEFHWGDLLTRRYHSYHLQRIVRHICDLYRPQLMENAEAELLAGLSAFVVEKPDHGLFSSLITQNFLRANINEHQVDQVGTAIALHNQDVARLVSGLIGQLTFQQDPLSFLLAYCDLAQDWGRIRPLARQPGADGSFGFPVFAGAPVYDEAEHVVRVVLRYPGRMDARARAEWEQKIYERYIQPLQKSWKASKARGDLRFCIEYRVGRLADGNENQLAVLDL